MITRSININGQDTDNYKNNDNNDNKNDEN